MNLFDNQHVMKYFSTFFHTILVLLTFLSTNGQTSDFSAYAQRENSTLRICFYNLENFFDTIDNPDKNDDSFTPTGNNHWTSWRFHHKAQNIAKVLIAIGGLQVPDIVGVCEIENENVIKKLLYGSPLKKFDYQYFIFQSPDPRGINTALLYRPATFKVLEAMPIVVKIDNDTTFKTRNILYIKGLTTTKCKDTLHIFVNHWTSRYGGYANTIEKRNKTAQLLRLKVDTLLSQNPQAKILIMGDFNDYPDNESITKYLNAPYKARQSDGKSLVNMMYPYLEANNKGTNKFGQMWGILDQFFASFGLLNDTNGLHTVSEGVIFDADFLLIDDPQNMGKKTFRTYTGMSYTGGFSDHLPIFIDVGCP
ncbi:MAG: endonuclease [Bacteroidales bacterium]|jgi:predicted extracellular nuclease|nr:endonuclease [Bacteroidales bacterium]